MNPVLEHGLIMSFNMSLYVQAPARKCAERGLPRKPLHVPLARALDVPDNHLERVKRRHSVEGNVEENQAPFEKGVNRVS